MPALTERVETGVYEGLYTTPEKKHYVERLQEVLQENVPEGSTFSAPTCDIAAYVMMPAETFAPCTWDVQSLDRGGFTASKPLLDYYEAMGAIPDIMLTTNAHVPDFFDNPLYEIKSFLADHYEQYYTEQIGDVTVCLWRNNSLSK